MSDLVDGGHWQEKLNEKYKHLFDVFEGEVTERSYYRPGQVLRGVETPFGWQKLTERLLENIDWLCKNRRSIPNPDFDNSKEAGPDNRRYIDGPVREVKIFQIKEKFAELRCYVTKCDPDMNVAVMCVIAGAEREAELTCMSCGKIGEHEVTKGGWVSIYCADCLERMKNERAKREPDTSGSGGQQAVRD